jgi:pimeloyl-ACP methyl ester carboxylesterase
MSMHTTVSKDGTIIAYDRLGNGPPVVMVAGAFNDRATTAPLAIALQDRFTILNPDRRGRGDSGDSHSYAVEREIEDLDALIGEAGGAAAVFGYSSGAMLALRAAAHGLAITHLALYDAPFLVDDSRPGLPPDFVQQLEQLIADGRRGDAVELYQRVCIGIPEALIVQMRHAPFRRGLEEIAHTLVYEARLVGDLSIPRDLLASVEVPALVMDGEDSPPFIHPAAQALVEALPDARRHTLAGQTHDLAPDAIAPLLKEFLLGSRSRSA